MTGLLTALEQHIETGRYVGLCSGVKLPLLVNCIYRCKFVHKPAGIGALVPERAVRERYSKVYATYIRVRAVLSSDANEYLPLYRLHDVLMIEICDHLNVGDRHNIAAVSRRFRSIALNTSRLWRTIDFLASPSVPLIRTLLKRAGTAPLHIRVTDDQLNAMCPSLPSPKISALSRPLAPPPRPPLPPLSPPAHYPLRRHPPSGTTTPKSTQPSAAIQFDLNWFDPVFRNLTHLCQNFPRSRTIRTYRVCWGPLQTR